MSDPASAPTTVDPDSVGETLCVGKCNISVNGPLATITFTHLRPKAGLLVDSSVIEFENVVRARIVMTIDNLMGLRAALNQIVQ